ncbi:MAG: alpha-2-macroglobulin [Treponemataceae bacterium]|nr:alpha-2-macroglobulin [Treponemataceae bacterium]
MKRNRKGLFLSMTAVLTVLSFLLCCSKQLPENSSNLKDATSAEESKTASDSVSGKETPAISQETIPDSYLQDTFIEPNDFFTLDYTPYLPESEAALLNKTKTETIVSRSNEGQGSESIIPGLREIQEYQTDYSTKKAAPVGSSVQSFLQTGNRSASGTFTVEDWGPQGIIPGDIRRPSFYVLFSEPVVQLTALTEQASSSPYMEIEPPLEGVYRWYGTSLLSFDATEDCNPRQVYKIKLNTEMRSHDGKRLAGISEFETQAAPLEIEWYQPGFNWSIRNKEYVDTLDVPPEAAKELRVQFNYDVDAAEIEKISVIKVAGQEASFTVTQSLPDTVTYDIKSPIPFESTVILSITDNDKEALKAQYATLQEFHLDSSYPGSSYGKHTNPVNIYMSHPLNEASVLDNITTQPYMQITKDNINVSGNVLMLYGLPVAFGETYTIEIDKGLEDIYGRKLGKKESIKVEVPDANSYVHFQNSGIQILEAQFPHKMLFAYQNIDDASRYRLEATDTPLNAYKDYDKIQIQKDSEGAVELQTEPRNTSIFQEVNLDPYLKDGKGAVYFEALVNMETTNYNGEKEKYKSTNSTTIQVTDLGVTARVGINKTAVLVSRISDGKPVEGATVYLYKNGTKTRLSDLDNGGYFAKAISNAAGLAVLEYSTEEAEEFFKNENYSMDNNPALYVATADDSVTFFPDSHSPWRHDVYYTSEIADAFAPVQKTFMFCDRGLYKPGETVTFRGIDRDKQAGSYTPYKGKFTIFLEDYSWWEAEIYDSLSEETSETGGFYGSFTIPEDLEPGTYKLRYQREGSTEPSYYDPYIELKVAYFERLKFQTSIDMPSTPIIAGDNIPASLEASYLAGGVLSSASYQTDWFREPWYFTSEEEDFKDFRFGPSDTSENRTYISSEEGSLDAEGKAELSCKTGGESLKGVPYSYRLSANVTDASNQLISKSKSTIVHPASFYAGLMKEASPSAFPSTGENLTFKYKLAFPDGKAVSQRENMTKTMTALAGESRILEVKLFRTDWNLVKQQGIGGNVYTRYEKEEVEEYSTKVKLEAEGSLKVTPKQAGYHTLRISTKDSQGRSVLTDYTFFVTGSGAYNWYSTSAASLRLTPDQSQYNPGDTAHILLESPLPSGDYLITTEREGIFTEEVRHFDNSIQVLDIPVARNYVPVFYVSISSYSVRTEAPHYEYGEKDVDKPQGYYGVTPVYVNPYVKAFSLNIDTGSQAYRPGEEVTVTITATKGGKALENAEITLMAVDRGVLDLIDYHVPDPINFYYQEGNFPLCVKGGDDRSYLMDPVVYETKNLAGGDAEGSGDKAEERKDFNPTAVFEPVLKTDKEGKAVCKFKLPDTLTTYRITVFGVNGELLALQEDEFLVKNPINVQQVMPRRLRIRDTAEMGVILSNLDSIAHEMTVSLHFEEAEASSENGVAIKTGLAIVDGESSHTVTVGAGSTIALYFDGAAVEDGTVNAVFTATSEGILNERIICPLIIEKPYIYETFCTTGVVSEEEEHGEENVLIPSFAEEGKGSISITLDATRLGTLGSAVNYVFSYPYGCLEQQSAKVLPLVLFEEYLDVFGMEMSEKISDVRSCVKAFFKNWADCQLANGSFGYWPESTTGNPFVTARIAHILQLASERGYTNKDICINRQALIKALKLFLKEDTYQYPISDYEKAYIYYVLAISGDRSVTEKDLKTLTEDSQTPISELVYTALASYKLFGKNSPLVKDSFERTRAFIRPGTRGADITYPEMDELYAPYAGSKDEQLALLVKFYTMLDPEDEMISRLIFTLLNNQKAGYWSNTATTASVLDAFYTVIKTNKLDSLDITAAAGLGSTQLAKTKFEGPASQPYKVELPFSDDIFKGLKTGITLPLTFSRSGTGSLYYTASLTYPLPYENLLARDEGISVSYIIYDDTTGEEIEPTHISSSLQELQSGRIYRAKLTISSPRDRTFLAIRVPVPSGAEILDPTFITTPIVSGETEEEYDYRRYYDHNAIYDNEIQYFWDSFEKGYTSTTFKFRAVRRGVYPTPPVTAECMYEPEVLGRTEGLLYTIK